MSIRLKNRHQCPPGGFQFTQKETGWSQTTWDFRAICVALQKHRIANPKFKLNTNLGAIMDEVDEANARRVLAIRGADIYVASTEGSPPKPSAPRPAAGVGANPVTEGLRLLKDLLEGDPVNSELSNARAGVCVACPKNGKGDWKKYFTVPAAHSIKLAIEARTGLKLSTVYDDKLGICEVCTCPLQVKVHTQLATVMKHTTPEVMEQLPEFCWINRESNVANHP